MRKILLFVLISMMLHQAIAQTITPTGIGMGTRRTNATSNVDFIVNPQQLSPGIFIIPNQIILVNNITFTLILFRQLPMQMHLPIKSCIGLF